MARRSRKSATESVDYGDYAGYGVHPANEAKQVQSLYGQEEDVEAEPKARGLGFTGQILFIVAIALAAVGATGLIGNAVQDKARDISSVISEEASVSEPAAPAPPVVEAAPVAMDLTGFWLVVGAVGAVIVIALAGTFTVVYILRSRHGAAELRKKQAAEAEDRRKALLVWQQSVDRHRELSSKVIEIETDWTMLFSYPALVDASVPATREFHRALREIETVSSEPPAGLNLAMDISELSYPRLVAAANEAWLSAWSFAQHTGTKLIPRGERKKIDQILKLLKLAQSSGGSEAERSVAYGRAEKLIRELQFVKVPPKALQAIGAEQRLMIEGSPVQQPTEAVADASSGSKQAVFAMAAPNGKS